MSLEFIYKWILMLHDIIFNFPKNILIFFLNKDWYYKLKLTQYITLICI